MADPAALPGGRVGPEHFKLLKMLGRGDVGKVYLVRRRGTKEYYAMKILDKKEMLQRKKIKRVMTEREILATADHPFIVTLYHSFQSESKLYFVMDYCAGGPFFRTLQRQSHKRLPEQSARFYAAEVLLALEYLHMMGFIYRDLKPENILLHASGHVMLTDFDLSKASATPVTPKLIKQMFDKPQITAEPSTVTNSFVGTEEYIAPEIIHGYGHTATVDWWTFGVLMFEMLFGITPFRGKSQEQTFHNVLHKDLKFPEDVPISKECKDFVRKLLRTDPKKRLGSVTGAPDLKGHNFFKTLNWALIRNQTPPIIPSVSGPLDTRYFRKYDQKISGLPDDIQDSSSDDEPSPHEKKDDSQMKVTKDGSNPSEEVGVNEADLPEKDPFREFKSVSKPGY
mmetsp:Transcript_40184/g.55892  ORF Transcript_40184/g.55892 Transcript_40184/m.55892 type:complete len:396 (-) Transcript_40184:53-1240(-)|eukprot:CAMPEP_0201478780 /NCGR_PEP_ID=MMETSP0151_2-20130828/3556_1 /ASSEMBLY_ACC=CAM_ASM_000257 /TAXON_ID=200890 /ORGANISM="Paramoeba atlantica, Strain 621/1 / CCAP 1560/9" /LENGTH=395 /DNA_ID=CAMNT_0047859977 /DNA_START=70 /DNA_END=1257 /DNA_ORIENTATION=+